MPALKPPKTARVDAIATRVRAKRDGSLGDSYTNAFVDELEASAKQTSAGLRAVTEARVEEIAATFRDGSFRYGVTLPSFRAKWELSEHRVAELSTLAQKKIAAEQAEDHARIRAKSFAVLERVIERAEKGSDPKTGNDAGHLAVAIKAVDTLLVRSGAAAVQTSKVHVTGDLSALSDEQLEAKAQELIAKLKGAM